MIGIVESRADSASVHICNRLRELTEWETRWDEDRPDGDGGGTFYRTAGAELRQFDESHIHLERPAAVFESDIELLVFASRHAGETGPLLTGHFTGNFGPAEYGGNDYALAETCPNALERLLSAYDQYVPDGYDVGLECTHHGPTDVGSPSLFAELGSGEEQWDDPAGATAVARSILELRDVADHRDHQVVGFGGGHYVPRFERIVRETSWTIGHVAADWGLEAMGVPTDHSDLIAEAFETSRTDLAVVDGDRPAVEAVIDELGYRVVSETWLREVEDRDRSLVDAVESTFGAVDEGIRFGDRREETFVVESLSRDLIDVTEGIDPDRVRSIVEQHSVAFETTNGGSRIGTRIALPTDDSIRSIVDDLASLLEEQFESVRVESDAVVVEENAFDPKRAATAGVPEGPKFGELAAGNSVTVDGKRVNPEDVFVERTRRFRFSE